MKKWKVLAVALQVCCLAILTVGTLAYFTAEERAHNVITTGGIQIELLETTDQKDANGNPVPFENVSGVMPGERVSKIVQVKNTGANPAYVRVRVDKSIRLAENVSGDADISLIGLDYNTADWVEQDGYYYYKKPLAPETMTTPLFEHVSFSGDMDNLYKKCSVDVDVCVFAVQSENNGTDVLQAKGWPADTNH